ncbi:uncharacterized protein KNAG_0L00180 [Huiozyma naganishii CBS 8797]|uniref:Uncharacterized protein n=1 Tax=Huiozyma naganishii (strain ATCC MYA-139 / BCRC 22969 / CBS 8797 / KCTC 17520 / NBRC 10181 / NCYC 3082 / Yp74L-3) TaxID=1071383 RepID=J7SB11_HUIN7|nr:hypothetical protein KNAG_0L00180 [Kazachstania naganishii CBS 8797]CCK72641.1 hypothetical protein KNAG_0L00180 [Kazachstania naganishii CBS 8797]
MWTISNIRGQKVTKICLAVLAVSFLIRILASMLRKYVLTAGAMFLWDVHVRANEVYVNSCPILSADAVLKHGYKSISLAKFCFGVYAVSLCAKIGAVLCAGVVGVKVLDYLIDTNNIIPEDIYPLSRLDESLLCSVLNYFTVYIFLQHLGETDQ